MVRIGRFPNTHNRDGILKQLVISASLNQEDRPTLPDRYSLSVLTEGICNFIRHELQRRESVES
jgi:hypothetical protein